MSANLRVGVLARAVLGSPFVFFLVSSCATSTDTAPPPAPSLGSSGSAGSGDGSAGGPTGGSGGATTPDPGGSAGFPSGGTFGLAGTGGIAGTATGGGGSGGAGGAGGTAGSGGSAGTGGAGNGGSSGKGGAPPVLDCDDLPAQALPLTLLSTWGYPDSGDDSWTEAPVSGEASCPGDQSDAIPNDCWSITWTPMARDYVHWHWHNMAGNWLGQGVCVEEGASAVTLRAKAETDGVEVRFSAADVDKDVTLDTGWQDVTIDISGANYAGPSGVRTGLVVVMARPSNDTSVRKIYFDDVRWID